MMGSPWAMWALVLPLALPWGAWGHPCQAPEQKCDFVCDCSDCSDEQSCGYREKDFVCDFEDEGLCGWREGSLDPSYTWERRQRGDSLPDSGPASDYTTGTALGWFVGVSAVEADSPRTAVFTSPQMQQSSPTCRLRLRYFLWDSGHAGLGSTPLWAAMYAQGSREAVVWRPESSSVRAWREATIFLGRIPAAFQVRLYSLRSAGRRADVAVDHLEFLDCALPLPTPGLECATGMLECRSDGCVEQRQVCDGTDDCGDGTDEENCGDYLSCDFEKDLCMWDLRSLSSLKWVRTNQNNISTTDPLNGPGRDHSTNSASGHFLYVTVPDGGLKKDWASFQSPLLEPTNDTHPCKMVLYSHQFGPRSGGLTVLVAERRIYPIWERGGALGDLWVKAEVEIVTASTFFIVVMAAIRDTAYGGVAVDSLTLSPECRISNGSYSFPILPKPPKHPCTDDADKICNFNADCAGGEDEAECGDFFHPQGSSSWTDSSIGSQGWRLEKNSTSKVEYLYVAEAPGQQLTEAQTRTPPLGPSGPACTLNFSYALTGNPSHIGELSVGVVDSVLGRLPKLWEFSGKTGTEEAAWRKAEVNLGARKHRFQVAFEARAKKLCPCAKIKVKDVHFRDCNAEYFPASSTELSCNFEEGLCGWFQDQTDNFDWTLLQGMDHTIGMGSSLTVEVWDTELRGASGRLLSYPQPATTQESCLSFYYKLYGPDTGELNVKVMDSKGFEMLLWTRSGAHGNMWNEEHCSVPGQLTPFQLVFEVVRSGFDGQVAIDDLHLMEAPCTLPRICSFEGQQCGYSSSGATRWLHGNSETITRGPQHDHTLETQLGYYMMVHTGADVLPAGSRTTLTSPVRPGVAKTECLEFWYHMGGANPGSLSVYMKPARGERVKMFSDDLNQGEIWRHGNSNITSTLVDWQLEFEVIGAGGKDTHVAIDDVRLSAHPCQGSKCSFERGTCGWSNTQSDVKDKLDWDVTSAEAEKHYSTPPHDHTLMMERGHFLFLPSSSRTPANHNAQLLSPHLPATRGTCLKFWAHRPSSANSLLRVWRFSENQLHELLVVTAVRAMWKRFDVNITSTHSYQVVFEGMKGTAGVLALDDIDYTVGINCAGEVTDPIARPARDNRGGMGASIIVVLLLIGTLITLLVLYLRSRDGAGASAASAASAAGQSAAAARAGSSFSNEIYEPDVTQDRVTVPPMQNHPMAAGFNNVFSFEGERVMEVA